MMVENDIFWGELRQISGFKFQGFSSDGFCVSLTSCLLSPALKQCSVGQAFLILHLHCSLFIAHCSLIFTIGRTSRMANPFITRGHVSAIATA